MTEVAREGEGEGERESEGGRARARARARESSGYFGPFSTLLTDG